MVRKERQQRNGTEDEKEEDVGYGWREHRGSVEIRVKRRIEVESESTNGVGKVIRAGYSWLWWCCVLFVV